MTTLSFKAQDELKEKLTLLAGKKGINVSAMIKLLLTEALNEELGRVTKNGMTVAEELAILHSLKNEKAKGPFDGVMALKKRIDLNTMLSQINPGQLHPETDTGKALGNEQW